MGLYWRKQGGVALVVLATLTLALPQSTALAPVTTNNGGGTGLHCTADKLKSSACKVVCWEGGRAMLCCCPQGGAGFCAAALKRLANVWTFISPLCYLDL